MLYNILASCLFILLGLTGCTNRDKGDLPTSTGQPYEVLLEGDTLGIVAQMLEENVDILPQPEPMCDVISVGRGKVKGSYLLMRTRVVVNIREGENYSIKVSHNENAVPQTIIRIHAASIQQLQDSLSAGKLLATIYESEQKHLAAVIKQNPEKQKLVKQLFGINMKIPASLDASKEGKDFLWLSNNASRGMQNLVFIRVNARWEKEAIDSMLQKNMVGETDGMYMQLTRPKIYFGNTSQGLWEMKGDAMGGPYRLCRLPLAKGKGALYIIGFVYAPEMKKRNLMKQLEAVMSTAKSVY